VFKVLKGPKLVDQQVTINNLTKNKIKKISLTILSKK